jgi:hypothetical protein
MPKKINLGASVDKLRSILSKIAIYRYVLFIIAVAVIYGYTIVHINSFDSAVPSQAVISQQSKAIPTPQIDKTAAQQLESLQNNNVSVQVLFEQARNNPFQE